MSPKRVQLFFFCGVCAIGLHFTIRLGAALFHNWALSASAPAQITQWETVPVKDRVALRADYEFRAQEKTWQGQFTLPPPYSLNELAALAELKQGAKKSWVAWYNPNDPRTSALEKSFPSGLFVRALICYGVLIYFFYLYKKFSRV